MLGFIKQLLKGDQAMTTTPAANIEIDRMFPFRSMDTPPKTNILIINPQTLHGKPNYFQEQYFRHQNCRSTFEVTTIKEEPTNGPK